MKIKNQFKIWLLTVIISVFCVSGIFIFFKQKLTTVTVSSNSMEPNYVVNETICANPLLFFQRFKRGDVILYTKMNTESLGDLYLGRIIGLSGEKVTIKDKKVYINGTLLNENYLKPYTETNVLEINEWQLKENEYFIMGDNRNYSSDSRLLGPIKNAHIKMIEVKNNLWCI
jgi:signal peptidase I